MLDQGTLGTLRGAGAVTVPRPATIAIARLQAIEYGRATELVTTRSNVESEAYASLGRRYDVRAVVPVSAALLGGSRVSTIADVTRAAAAVSADVVLVYSIGSKSDYRNPGLGPVDVLTLGLLPVRSHEIHLTAIASLVDVDTGYLLGVATVDETDRQLGNAWSEDDAYRDALRRAEDRAITRLFDDFAADAWPRVLAEFPAH